MAKSGFTQLAAKLKRREPAIKNIIGRAGVSQIQGNFKAATDPITGMKWPKLSKTTIARRRKKSNKPLLDTGGLRRAVGFEPYSEGIIFGLPESYKYGETHQFGATKGQYGVHSVTETVKEHKRKGFTVRSHSRTRSIITPWGDVPQRRFMGFSDKSMKILLGQYKLEIDKTIKEVDK